MSHRDNHHIRQIENLFFLRKDNLNILYLFAVWLKQVLCWVLSRELFWKILDGIIHYYMCYFR